MKTRPLSLSLYTTVYTCTRKAVAPAEQSPGASRGRCRAARRTYRRPTLYVIFLCVRVWRRYFFRQNSSLFQENTHSKERRTVKIHKTPSLISQSAEPPPRSCCRRHGGVAHLFQLREQQTLLPYPVLIYRQIDSVLLFSLFEQSANASSRCVSLLSKPRITNSSQILSCPDNDRK